MPFLYDRVSGQSGLVQYNNYIDNQLYLRELRSDVKDITNYQIIELRKAIGKNDVNLKELINSSTENISNNINGGFAEATQHLSEISAGIDNINDGINDINWRLNEINDSIDKIYSLVDWKTDNIIEQQRISNFFLDFIAKNINLTEREKQNLKHNRNGNFLLKKAINEGPYSTEFSKALSEFIQAYEYDEYDYLCQKQLGFIYLNSRTHQNISEAESYYSQAISNILTFNPDLQDIGLKKLTASSFFDLSICNDINDNLQNAIENILKAIRLDFDNIGYKIQLARYRAANGQEKDAAVILEYLIDCNSLSSIDMVKEIENDRFLISIIPVKEVLNEKTIKQITYVKTALNRINAIMIDSSIYANKVREIIAVFNPPNYITATKAKFQIEGLYEKILLEKKEFEVKKLKEKEDFDYNLSVQKQIKNATAISKIQRNIKVFFITILSLFVFLAIGILYKNHLDKKELWETSYGHDIYPNIKTISSGEYHLEAGVLYKYLGFNFDGSEKKIEFSSGVDNNQIYTQALSNGYVGFSIKFSDDNFTVREGDFQIPFFHNPLDYK